MSYTSPWSELSAEWRDLRRLHPLYVALAREFVLECPPCADLETGVEGVTEEAIQLARQWFKTMDGRIQVYQLRQFLQTTPLTDNETLRILLVRQLAKQQPSPPDRDKTDFLLVQFFSFASPSRLDDNDCDLEYVAQMLEPVLGAVELTMPEWLQPLEPLISLGKRSRRLSEFFHHRVLEQGRKLKIDAKQNYFLPVAMVAFTRFSFLMRRVFFRLMHEDLDAILNGLYELEKKGIRTLDCRKAHFSHHEPADRLRMICHSWKVMFHAEYSSGQPLKMLADLRLAVEEALLRAGQPQSPRVPPAIMSESRSRTAAAGAQATRLSWSAPELRLSPQSADDKAT